jgi:hypothetical protein
MGRSGLTNSFCNTKPPEPTGLEPGADVGREIQPHQASLDYAAPYNRETANRREGQTLRDVYKTPRLKVGRLIRSEI